MVFVRQIQMTGRKPKAHLALFTGILNTVRGVTNAPSGPHTCAGCFQVCVETLNRVTQCGKTDGKCKTQT